ncbi:hypothetical protein BH09ACT8_BH09ACT8_22980 [soil metagenome]
MLVDGAIDPDCEPDGTPLIDDDFLVLVNAWWEPVTFDLSGPAGDRSWRIVCDTFDPQRVGPVQLPVTVKPRAVSVLHAIVCADST